MKTTRTFLYHKPDEDSCDTYSRNRNILKFLDRLNKIKFRESQYLEKDILSQKYKKNSKSMHLSNNYQLKFNKNRPEFQF
jgi:hypothetical protein